MKKVIGVVALLLLALTVAAFIGSYLSFRKSLPETAGEIVVSGIHKPVRIYRDEYGIPHIFAETDDDVRFGLGWAIAQDRLWQLELVRRAVNGRLSEIFGDTTLVVDRLLLTLGIKRIAGEIFPKLSPEAQAAARAYVQGINAFIEYSRGRYPVEFALLQTEPGFWDPEDCVGLARLMGWELSFAWYIELWATQMADSIGTKRVRELIGDYWPQEWPIIVTPGGSSSVAREWLIAAKKLENLLGGPLRAAGSNSWVVAGRKSKSGKPILANDPHLVLSNPSRWYQVHLVAPGLNVAGFTLPGSPAIVIGFNQAIAWGFTNLMTDDVDFFALQLHPGDTTQYWAEGTWRTFRIVRERIPIRGRDDQILSVRISDFGPVINAIHPRAEKSSVPIAVRWIGQDESDELLALLRANRASSWEEFREAIRAFRVPGQNIVYADTAGTIAYWAAGAVPIRSGFSGMFVVPARRNWNGYVPFEKMPHKVNPPEGFIATANNRVTDPGYPYPISYLWEPPSRISRIVEWLSREEPLSVEEMRTLQMDVYSPFAAFLVPKILPVCEQLAQEDEKYQEVFRFLRGWDYQLRGESVAASIFQVFVGKFLTNILADELGQKAFEDYLRIPGLAYRFLRRLYEQDLSHWFDDQRTAEKRESPGEIVRKSLVETVKELTDRFGSDMIRWRWDRLHRVTFRHILGDQPMVGNIFNVGPFPMGGSHTTVNNGSYSFVKPYDCIIGASMRMIVDLAKPGQAAVVNPPGQVGHPLSRHYRDQVDLWLNGLNFTLDTDTVKVVRSGYDLLRLVPEKSIPSP